MACAKCETSLNQTHFKYIPVTEETERDFANGGVVSALNMSDDRVLNAAVVNEMRVGFDVVPLC